MPLPRRPPFPPGAVPTLHAILEKVNAPVPVQDLAELLRLLVRTVNIILRQEAGSGTLYVWPKQDGKARYWSKSPAAMAERKLLEATAAGIVSEKDLTSLAKVFGITGPALKKIALAAIESGKLKAIPDRAKPKQRNLVNPIHPEPHLVPLLAEMRNLAAPLLLRNFLSTEFNGLEDSPEIALEDSAKALYDAISALEPTLAVPVFVAQLRRLPALARVSKEDFDRAALLLQSRRRVYLHERDSPLTQPSLDVSQLIQDAHGKHYVAISRRE